MTECDSVLMLRNKGLVELLLKILI